MKKIAGLVLLLVALIGLLYLIVTTVHIPAPALMPGGAPGVQINVVQLYDDSAAYTVHVQYPQFGIANVDAVVKNYVDKAVADIKTLPPNPPDSATPQDSLEGTFDAIYVGPDVVSAELIFSEDTGGAHPNTALLGVNVNRSTGKELTLDDALSMIGLTLQQVSDTAKQQLQQKLGDGFAFPDGAAPTADNYGVFLVSADKVTFVFNDYQVAPYSEGPQQVSFARKN